MSGRLHAVANAIADQDGWTSYSRAQKAIDAADIVMFSEAAIERAAEMLYEAAPYVRMLRGNAAVQWYSLSDDQKKLARTQARAVVAALREEA